MALLLTSFHRITFWTNHAFHLGDNCFTNWINRRACHLSKHFLSYPQLQSLVQEVATPILGKFGMTPLLAAVYVGSLQNIFSKSAKYSLFDPCKEMAYIPFDEYTKVKGKVAIDVVCNPLGKSGGALIQRFLILIFGSLANSTPYFGGILMVIELAWFFVYNTNWIE